MRFVLFFSLFFGLMTCCSYRQKDKSINEASLDSTKQNSIDNYSAIAPDTKSFEMVLPLDTFPVTVKRIPITIVNHLADTLTCGTDFSLDYYDNVTTSWKDVLPPDLVFTHLLYVILPKSQLDLDIALLDNDKPGKYRIIKKIITPRKNTIVGEFVLSPEAKLPKEYEYLMTNKGDIP